MRKLHQKLAVSILGTLVVVLGVVSTLVVGGVRKRLGQDLDHMGKALAETIAAFCVETIVAGDYPYLETYVEKAARKSPHVAYIRVWSDFDLEDADATRRLVARYPRSIPRSGIGGDRRVFHSPIVMEVEGFPPEVLGKVEVALSTERHDKLMRTSTWQLLVGGCAVFLSLAFLLAYILKKNVIEPVRRLDDNAARIGKGDLEKPIAIDSRDELGRLAETMESMRRGLKSSYQRIENQVEELKELDRLKDEFLANTSHELKTPLNGILGIAEGMLLGDYGEVPEDIRQPLETVISCSERLWKMTDSILRYSRLVNKKEERRSESEVHRIEDHLHECLLDILTSATHKGIRFLITVPPELEVKYPRADLEQVVRILADNAVKFTQDGVIQVIVRKWEGEPKGFQLAVRDTGKGIKEAFKNKIFEPFVQGFQHETRSESGVGLGLSIASKMVSQAGWRLLLETEEGKGTTFTILAPEEPCDDVEERYVPWPPMEAPERREEERRSFQESRPDALEASRSGPPVASGDGGAGGEGPPRAHVLVCDDDAINREVVWLALKNDYDVTQVDGGEACLEILERDPIDLLVLDIMMPRVSGYDVLARMRERGLLEHIPVVVLSAKSSPRHTVKGLRLGASDYIGKPFHRDELVSRIRTQLQIKEQKEKLEQEVEAKEQALSLAREASRVKSQFLSNMSHEILTPLNGIQGFLDLMDPEEARTDPEHQLDYLEKARTCTRNLLEVARNILDIARIEAKAVDLDLHRCDIFVALREVVESFREAARAKGLALELGLSVGESRVVRTDPDRFRQVVANLVSNALKFTDTGSVRIEVRYADATGREVLVDVIDTGIGLDPGEQARIFEPFHQVDASLTREHGGVGIGLSLSRLYAHMLGGEIEVESAPGKGSRFTLRLPVEPVGGPGDADGEARRSETEPPTEHATVPAPDPVESES